MTFIEECVLVEAPHTIAQLQKTLRGFCTPWQEDGSVPANWERLDGMGEQLAYVSRRAAPNAHKPPIIVYRATLPGCSTQISQYVLVADPDDSAMVDEAIQLAKDKADAALCQLLAREGLGSLIVMEEGAV